MPTYILVILDVIIIWFFFGNYIIRFLMNKRQKMRADLKSMEKHFRALYHRDADILPSEKINGLLQAMEELHRVRQNGNEAEMAGCLKKFADGKSGYSLPEARQKRWLIDNFEVLLVSLAVAFGIRSLLAQPFKIPTGSMQPTLYGIHYEERQAVAADSILKNILSYVNCGERVVYVTAPRDCDISFDMNNFIPWKSLPFFPKSAIIAKEANGTTCMLPVSAAPVNVIAALCQQYSDEISQAVALHHSTDRVKMATYGAGTLHFKAGENILSGVMVAGDHPFVNRLALCFREPIRGEVMVFNTEGLLYKGAPLGGAFYIKRLIGMPGDTLKIVDGRVWVKPAGENDFHPLTEKDHPSFGKVYSGQNGYHGHQVMGSDFLTVEGDEYLVPPDSYFMMGDNTANSLDSRYWGPVPRKNLIGPACFIFWPFSERFAAVDR